MSVVNPKYFENSCVLDVIRAVNLKPTGAYDCRTGGTITVPGTGAIYPYLLLVPQHSGTTMMCHKKNDAHFLSHMRSMPNCCTKDNLNCPSYCNVPTDKLFEKCGKKEAEGNDRAKAQAIFARSAFLSLVRVNFGIDISICAKLRHQFWHQCRCLRLLPRCLPRKFHRQRHMQRSKSVPLSTCRDVDPRIRVQN